MQYVKPDQRNLSVLLVEDDEVDIMNVQRSFRKNKITHDLEIARDGLEAIDKLRSGTRPHVILLDINLPRMNGIEFLREIRQDPKLKGITVFVMSTSSNPMDKAHAFAFNVAGYIVKPLSSEDFSQSMQRLAALWEICEFP